MKSFVLSSSILWQRLLRLLLVGVFLGSSGSLTAAGWTKALDMNLSTNHRHVYVKVPDGVANVTVQRFDKVGGWRKVISTKAVAGVMKFKLPVTGMQVQWRALGWYQRAKVSHEKFPTTFYAGKTHFGPVKSNGGTGLIPGSNLRTDSLIAGDALAGTGSTPVEADIWKVDGNTVYFFNQLRGLQVLDLTNPADPRLTASLRLPAVGQDLYLLPSASAASRTVVLLTEGWSDSAGQWTRINVVKVSGRTAQITYTQDVVGSLADSRMVDSRLILATTEWNYADSTAVNGWSARTHLSEWQLDAAKAPAAAGETLIEGDSPLISSGPDWLALAVNPSGQWDVSDVSVFAVRPQGLVRMAQPIRTEGSIASKFAMQWRDNVLTTISEHNVDASGWSPTTVLENFRAWSPDVIHPDLAEGRLGRLELATGESLYSTRFAGNKAYVVTYLQTDPLWVVDLADPASPVVAGQLEVPGWTSHLEPIGDMLFAIGWESNTVVASLFDVANPASPQLLRRLSLGEAGTYSEAMWDEKALKVLPDAGLALIPLSTYDYTSGNSNSVVQLLDIDLSARDMSLRGKISHAFDARRADLIGNTVVSISQRVLVDADITNRDAPQVLSEVSLAWPVDRVILAGSQLLQIEDGNWYSGRATARISTPSATEEILSETDLGEGTVKAAEYRNGNLYILRETGSRWPMFFRIPSMNGSTSDSKVMLDIYTITNAPGLTLLGSCSMTPSAGGQVAGDHLLWPQPNRPATVVDYRTSFWFGGPIMFDSVVRKRLTLAPQISSVSSLRSDSLTGIVAAASPLKTVPGAMLLAWPFWNSSTPDKAPDLILFDTSDLTTPVVEDPASLGVAGLSVNGVSEAADGLIVLGTSQSYDSKAKTWLDYGKTLESACVVEVQPTGSPVVRPSIEMPGELFAATELDSNGFLAFTRTLGDNSSTIQASACDGYDAFLITSLDEPTSYPTAAVGGRRLFVANDGGVECHLLSADGNFVSQPSLDVGWTPDSLRWNAGTLTGSTWNSLFVLGMNDNKVETWNFETWGVRFDRVIITPDRDVLVPFGDYGVERLNR